MAAEGFSYRYFVSYHHGRGFGSIEVLRTGPIVDHDDIVRITAEVIQPDLAKVFPQIKSSDIVVLFFTRYEDEET